MKTDKNYPLDLDSGLTYTRYPTGAGMNPYPQAIGSVQGIMPLLDTVSRVSLAHSPQMLNPADMLANMQIESGDTPKMRG